MSKFFISYAKKDAFEIAKDLRYRIQMAGLSAWMDDEDIPLGDRWRAVIDEAIEEAICMLVVITLGGLSSPHVTREWASAQAKGKEVVPVLFADVLSENREHPIFDLQYRDFRIQTVVKWEQLIAELQHIKAKRDIDPEVARAEAILKSPETDKWGGALKFLEICTHESATEALVRIINGHLPEVAARAAFVLNARTNYRDVRSVVGLAEGLRLSTSIRNRTIKELEAIDTEEAFECLYNDWSVSRKETDVVMTFTRMKCPRVEGVLRELLENDEYFALREVIEALGRFPSENLISRLAHLMDSYRRDVREASYCVLAKIGSQTAVDILFERLEKYVKEVEELMMGDPFEYSSKLGDLKGLLDCFTDGMPHNLTEEQQQLFSTAFRMAKMRFPELPHVRSAGVPNIMPWENEE